MKAEKKLRQPKQQRGVIKKQEILDTSKELFCKKGFYNVTTNEIAKTAGISIGSLYSYFVDKDAILMELVKQYNAHFRNVFKTVRSEINEELYSKDKKKWLRSFVEYLIELHEPEKEFAKELNSLYYTKPEVAKILDEDQDRISLMTYEAFLIHSEDLVSNDIKAVSLIFYDYITALVDRVVFKNHPIEKERILQVGVDCLYKMLIG